MTLPLIDDRPPLRTDEDGVVRVGATRVTLDVVIEAFHEGLTAEEIQQQYPALDLHDVYAALAYYLRHRDEVTRYLVAQEREREAARAEIDRRIDRSALRERLLARKRS